MKNGPDEKNRHEEKHIIEIEEEESRSQAEQDARNEDAGEGGDDAVTAEEERAADADRETASRGEQDLLVDELRAKADEYLDHLQRLKAEFENFRKRMQREREETWKRARGDLLLGLIPFLDDMRRLIDSQDPGGESASVIEGMKLIEKGIMDHLAKDGLERIEAFGSRFDPNLHEAMELQVVSEKEKDGLVAEELIRGFVYKGTLLRPARVKVYRYVQPDNENEDKENEDK